MIAEKLLAQWHRTGPDTTQSKKRHVRSTKRYFRAEFGCMLRGRANCEALAFGRRSLFSRQSVTRPESRESDGEK